MVAPVSLRKKIILGIVAALVVGIGVVVFCFRDDLGAMVSGLRYSSEELQQKMEENDQTIKDAAQLVPDITIRELTEADRQALKDGTITSEELVQSMIEPAQKPEPPAADAPQPPEQEGATSPQPPPEPGPEPEQPQVSDYQKQLAAIIAEVYVLREEFLIKLDNLMEQAKAEYLALPKAERTTTKIAGLASKYYSTAHSLELECDARMREIIGRMETLLAANGGDLSIAQAVYDTYLEEKSLKKSWYLAELKKRGI